MKINRVRTISFKKKKDPLFFLQNEEKNDYFPFKKWKTGILNLKKNIT